MRHVTEGGHDKGVPPKLYPLDEDLKDLSAFLSICFGKHKETPVGFSPSQHLSWAVQACSIASLIFRHIKLDGLAFPDNLAPKAAHFPANPHL
jgi:hypothetical protein